MCDLFIPYTYTKYVWITSLFILKNSYILFFNDEQVIGLLGFACYICTLLHWTKLKRQSMIKNIDMSICTCLYIYGVYRASFYDCFHRYNCIACLSILAFLCNEYLNAKTLYKQDFDMQPITYKNHVYYRSVLLHTIFLHILQFENAGTVILYCKRI